MRTEKEISVKFNELFDETQKIAELYKDKKAYPSGSTKLKELMDRHEEINTRLNTLNWVRGGQNEF